MKKISLSFFILLVTFFVSAQQSTNNIFGERNSSEKRGYIGLSIGPSIPLGDWSFLPAGPALNLVDFGYLFTDNFGIAGKLFGSAYKKSGIDYGANGLLGGLLASTPIAPKINLEGNLLIGAATSRAGIGGISVNTDLYFGYGIGAGLRYNANDNISLLLNADYLGSDDYSSVNLTLGVAYRLK